MSDCAPLQASELASSVAGRSSLQRMVRLHRVTDKSVRDLLVKAKLKAGQIIVEQSLCGIVFSFPAAVWPQGSLKQAKWVERLTPWWDMDAPDWTAQCQRLRDACQGAINNLLHGATPAPKTANVPQGMGLPETMSVNVRGRPMQPNDQAEPQEERRL